MTTTSTPSSTSDSSSDTTVRLSLKPGSEHPGTVQGAWWPRSRDLAAELPPLIAALDRDWTEINRATVNVSMWPDIPRVVRAGRHNVHIGWFDTEQQRDDICLLTYLSGRWDLLVVPPETDPGQAASLMSAAADTSNYQTTDALMSDPRG